MIALKSIVSAVLVGLLVMLIKYKSYRTKCVDENRFQALKIKGKTEFNLS